MTVTAERSAAGRCQPLRVLDRCRVRCGRVEAVDDAEIQVSYRPTAA